MKVNIETPRSMLPDKHKPNLEPTPVITHEKISTINVFDTHKTDLVEPCQLSIE
jgi:hypothetical protein